MSLWRAEGRPGECYPLIFVNSNIDGNKCEYHSRWAKATLVEERTSTDIKQDVHYILYDWGKTAPKSGGYDKTDFRVDFDNGFVYEGRFDMAFGGLDDGKNFFESLRGRLEYYSETEWKEWHGPQAEWIEQQNTFKKILEEWTEHE